jgi:hypothetical protein
MADAVAQAKDDIYALTRKIEVARNDELRSGLQRTKLEAERARIQAFVDMQEIASRYEAVIEPQPSPVKPEGAFSPDLATVGVPGLPKARHTPKPAGIPTTSVMVATALQAAGKPLRPVEIATYVRDRWWPEAGTPTISATVCRMGQDGRLSRNAGRYSLATPLLNGGSTTC